MKSIRVLLVVLGMITAFASCSDKDHRVEYQTVRDVPYASIEPTVKQAWAFAFLSKGYTGPMVLGVILLLIATVALVLLGFDFFSKFGLKDGHVIAASVILIVVFCFLALVRPGTIYGNNKKDLTKEYYDYRMSIDGNMQHIWDSLKVANKVVNAPMK